MTNAHGCIRRFCCGVDYSSIDGHLRVRHVVVRQVVVCSVTSGRVAGAGSRFDVDVEARDAHQVDVHLAMRQISTGERNGDVYTGRTFMYSLPVGFFHERLDLMAGHGRRAAGGRPTS